MSDVTHESTPSVGVKFHEYANLFPMLQGEALKQLTDDVRAYGVREPIVFLGEQILDGRNRYMVARDLGIDYPRVEFEGDDPLAYVISHNLHRRHLTESQRASIAARLAKMERGDNQHTAIAVTSQSQAAELLNVSTDSIQRAKKVHEAAPAEIADAVDDGRISVSLASKVADLPPEDQATVAAAPPENTKAVAREAVKKANDSEKKPKPRDGLSSMTREGLEDEIRGLRGENEDLRVKLAEKDETIQGQKAKLADLTQENQGATISRLHKQVDMLKGARDDALAKAAKETRRANHFQEEFKKARISLEAQEIPL